MLQYQVDYEREHVSKLFTENEALKTELEQLKLELKVERQSKFATSADKLIAISILRHSRFYHEQGSCSTDWPRCPGDLQSPFWQTMRRVVP
jgi:hypothetical protein